MKKLISFVLVFTLAVCAAGCAREKPAFTGGAPETPKTAVLQGEGWSFTYDPALFEEDGGTTVRYIGADSPMPVYLTVQLYPDYTAEKLAEGLVLQSGSDSVKAEDASVGRDSIPAKAVTVERVVGEISEVTQIQRLYALDTDKGGLLIEAGSYDGAPEAAQEGLDAILASFALA